MVPTRAIFSLLLMIVGGLDYSFAAAVDQSSVIELSNRAEAPGCVSPLITAIAKKIGSQSYTFTTKASAVLGQELVTQSNGCNDEDASALFVGKDDAERLIDTFEHVRGLSMDDLGHRSIMAKRIWQTLPQTTRDFAKVMIHGVEWNVKKTGKLCTTGNFKEAASESLTKSFGRIRSGGSSNYLGALYVTFHQIQQCTTANDKRTRPESMLPAVFFKQHEKLTHLPQDSSSTAHTDVKLSEKEPESTPETPNGSTETASGNVAEPETEIPPVNDHTESTNSKDAEDTGKDKEPAPTSTTGGDLVASKGDVSEELGSIAFRQAMFVNNLVALSNDLALQGVYGDRLAVGITTWSAYNELDALLSSHVAAVDAAIARTVAQIDEVFKQLEITVRESGEKKSEQTNGPAQETSEPETTGTEHAA